jgi:hypothetical protein
MRHDKAVGQLFEGKTVGDGETAIQFSGLVHEVCSGKLWGG